MSDPYNLSPNALVRQEDLASVADQEERETVDLTRKIRLQALKLMPDVLDMCKVAIGNKDLPLKDRLAAAKEIRETAGVARVAAPNIYIDQRSTAVNDEEAQFLFELGIGPAPTGKAPRIIEATSFVPEEEVVALLETEAEVEKPKEREPEREDGLPAWCKG